MRKPRALFALVLVAFAASGCVRSFPPARVIQSAAIAPPPGPVVRNDLDNLAYNGSPAGPSPVAQVAPAPYATAAPVAEIPAPPPVVRRRGFPPPVLVAAPPPPGVVPAAYAAPVIALDDRYRLDAGDRLRVVVFGQEGLTNTYAVGSTGFITMPLIGGVPARGLTPSELSGAIAAKLRNGFIREPSVAVEVEAYRPFFILGEVAAPGQYPYVPNMTVESAVAIAGGYSPRALRNNVRMTRSNVAGSVSAVVPPTTQVSPGDTIVVGERWF